MANLSLQASARRLALLLLLVVAGCAVAPEEEEDEKGPWYWPMPPDQPRFVYEGSLRYAEEFANLDNTTGIKDVLTGTKASTPAFEKPFGVAARFGRIYVTDTVGRQVVAFDVPRRKVFTFGYRLEGTLKKPLGIAVDDKQQIYVADVSAQRVVMYDGMGLFVRGIGSKDELTRPTGVAVNADGSRIYVVDAGGVESDIHHVVVYDGEGKKLFTIGRRGDGDGEFNLPIDAAVGPDGTLYVIDTGNFRVQAFDPDGKFLRKWGKVGSELGNFSRPRNIAVDRKGNVYVSDPSFSNVQVFNSQGELLLPIGKQSPTKDGPGRFALPAGVAVDETGRVYIADQFFKKVEVLRHLSEEESIAIMKKEK